MARYGVTFSIAGVSNQAIAWLRTTAGKDLRLWEAGIWEESGTVGSSSVGLGRPAAISNTSTALVPQAEDSSAGAAVIIGAVAASTKPTAPANYIRRLTLPAVLGSGIIWTFPQGLVVPTAAEVTFFNIGTATCTFGGYFCYEE